MSIDNSTLFEISPGLQQELNHLKSEPCLIYASETQLKEATENTLYSAVAFELNSRLQAKSLVVDIGCGFGESSLLLASYGHTVHSLDPALHRCQSIQKSFENLQMKSHVHVCTGESLHKIPLSPIDGALFYSSLHHCDDPILALKNVKAILKPNGVILISEPILRFYNTKKWYYKKMTSHPIKMGHYGGNEHIYYFKEYYNMLCAAGFKNIEFYWSNKTVDPRKTLLRDLSGTITGEYQHSLGRCLLKYLLHSIIKKMCHNTVLNTLFIKPLMNLSILQASFIGYAS